MIDNKADARDTSAIVERMTSRAELRRRSPTRPTSRRCSAALMRRRAQRHAAAAHGARGAHQRRAEHARRRTRRESGLLLARAPDRARCTAEQVKTIVAEAIDGIEDGIARRVLGGARGEGEQGIGRGRAEDKGNRQDVEELLQGHAERLHSSLSAKADVDAVSSALSSKASRAEVTEAVEARVDEARHALAARAISLGEEMDRQHAARRLARAEALDDERLAVCRRTRRRRRRRRAGARRVDADRPRATIARKGDDGRSAGQGVDRDEALLTRAHERGRVYARREARSFRD